MSTSWKIRLMFNTEGITTTIAGWLVGIPLGFGVGLYILADIRSPVFGRC